MGNWKGSSSYSCPWKNIELIHQVHVPAFYHGKSPGTHWLGGYCSSRMVRSGHSYPCRVCNPNVQPVNSHYTEDTNDEL
jgi:hypothetical protein